MSTDAEAFTLAGQRVFVAGHRGMAGAALVRRLTREHCDILTVDRSELDLKDAAAVRAWLERHRPDVVVLAAAKVGGIKANDAFPVEFLADNLAIELAVIGGAFEAGVRRLLFLGSTCVYPKHASQPMDEGQLLTGPLEPTNQWYAVAKIAGVKLCEAYHRQHGAAFGTVMPTNLYGPGDNYHPEFSHVPAALIRRFHESKLAGAPEVVVWGTGEPRREFMHVDDFADACVHVLSRANGGEMVNIGVGKDISIRDFAMLVAEVVGFEGTIRFDPAKPDGTPRKLVDVSRLTALGWSPRIDLRDGLADAYRSFLRGDGRGLDRPGTLT